MMAGSSMAGTVLAICWMLVASVQASGAADEFAAGNRAYAAGNYAEARKSYERALADGMHANVLYNLGNTFFRLGDPGHAALEYERALALRPRHPDAMANLKLAREKSGARVDEMPWWQRGLLYLRGDTATALALGGCWFFLLLGGSIAWRRRGSAGVWACALGALLAACYAAGVCWAGQEQHLVAIVVSERAEARTEPADRASVAEVLPAGSRVSVLSEHGTWNYCRLPNGQHGWVPASAVEFLVPHSKSPTFPT